MVNLLEICLDRQRLQVVWGVGTASRIHVCLTRGHERPTEQIRAVWIFSRLVSLTTSLCELYELRELCDRYITSRYSINQIRKELRITKSHEASLTIPSLLNIFHQEHCIRFAYQPEPHSETCEESLTGSIQCRRGSDTLSVGQRAAAENSIPQKGVPNFMKSNERSKVSTLGQVPVHWSLSR